MRFMMLMIPGEQAYASFPPQPEELATMGKYNESLAKAGVLLALDGLMPSASGARVSFSAGKGTVKDGPFTEAKELIGGYWIIQVDSKEEAVQWALRCPGQDGNVIEVRQVSEASDFGPETVAQGEALSEELKRRAANS